MTSHVLVVVVVVVAVVVVVVVVVVVEFAVSDGAAVVWIKNLHIID